MTSRITHLDDLERVHDAAGAAAAARPTEFVREVVEAATSRRIEGMWCSAVRCTARVGRAVCGARVHVGQPERGRIEWSCAACGGRGVVTGLEATGLDLSSYVARKRRKPRLWGFDEESRAVLHAATTHIPSLRAVIARARPAADIDELLLVDATVDELDEMYTLVEALEDGTRSRRRRDLLEGLRGSLCSAMDVF